MLWQRKECGAATGGLLVLGNHLDAGPDGKDLLFIHSSCGAMSVYVGVRSGPSTAYTRRPSGPSTAV